MTYLTPSLGPSFCVRGSGSVRWTLGVQQHAYSVSAPTD